MEEPYYFARDSHMAHEERERVMNEDKIETPYEIETNNHRMIFNSIMNLKQ